MPIAPTLSQTIGPKQALGLLPAVGDETRAGGSAIAIAENIAEIHLHASIVESRHDLRGRDKALQP